MGRSQLMSRAVRSAKGDRNIKLPARHHEHVGRVVHDLVERDQRKTPGHELDNRTEAGHGRANPEACETIFADGRVDDSFRAEALEQTLAHFISPMVLGDFLAHQENIWVALQLFSERFIQRLTISDFPHCAPPSKNAYLYTYSTGNS